MREHFYELELKWTGNKGKGTSDYRSYERSHTISGTGKGTIFASSDPSFRGDQNKYNPEELLLASLSSCHMLWFLHLCSKQGIVVIDYVDHPKGVMEETEGGGGKFKKVTLFPIVTIKEAFPADRLEALHDKAHELCFIANSVNFEVNCKAKQLVSQS